MGEWLGWIALISGTARRETMGAKLFWFPAFGLLALLLLGVALTGGAKTHAAAVEAATAAMSSGTEAGVLAPQTTPTPYFPDYLPALSWDSSYPCPAPVLDVHTIITGHATCQ